jgi:serine/threonine protein kinase
VSDDDDVDSLIVDCLTEDLDQYFCRSFYPIRIGDVLEDTYRIEHKLGYGKSSTVWLARDIKKGKDVALKIMIPGDEGEDEYSMQLEIKRTVKDTSNLVTCLTAFSLRGHEDNHRVLVFPVRGPNFNETLLLFCLAITGFQLLPACPLRGSC